MTDAPARPVAYITERALASAINRVTHLPHELHGEGRAAVPVIPDRVRAVTLGVLELLTEHTIKVRDALPRRRMAKP